MTHMQQAPSDEDIEFYAGGMCHVFAVALHRRFGWTIHLVLDQNERYWEDPADADNWIPSVVHAYAVDPDMNAWDVYGVRPIDAVRSEAERLFGIGCYDSDDLRSESELRTYVGCWAEEGDPIDRPLVEYGDREVAGALAAATRILGQLTGFPSVTPGLLR